MRAWKFGRWPRHPGSRTRTSHARPARGLTLDIWRGTLEGRVLLSVAELRIASYNIASATSTGAPRAGLGTILQAIGAEAVDGVSRPIDVLALQEVKSQATTTADVVAILNGIYGAGTYSRGSLDGASTGGGVVGLAYNTKTVQLVSESAVGTSSASGQPRQEIRYRFRPLGTSGPDDFYLYNGDYKAGSDSTSRNRRSVEARAVRADADALGPGVQVIYAGDFNTYSSDEAGYQALIASGNGQASDPINRPGTWHNNAAFAGIDNQATAVTAPSGLFGGGLNDRFDFQLISRALANGSGLEYEPGSYHAFGNNGSVPLRRGINDPANTALAGLPNRSQVLSLLTTVSDQLPVVADYVLVPSLSISGASLAEGNSGATIAKFRVALSQATSVPVTVHYASSNGTATAGQDYGAVSGTLTFTPGQAVQYISVPIYGDALGEPDEAYSVRLSSPTWTTLAVGQAAGTILNDDNGLSINDVSSAEGNGGTRAFTFTVSLSGPATTFP